MKGIVSILILPLCTYTCTRRACDGHCPYGELLLLIAIHLKEKQLDQIEELIADTLNMKVSVSDYVMILIFIFISSKRTLIEVLSYVID